MSVGPARFVARHVHDLIERQRLDALPDHALLARFVATRDDAAFAALVRRHGPMVLGVCRRILRHAQDAEDACQATFLILARKGGTIRGRRSVAGWLHRVAVRAAGRLRRDLARGSAEPLPDDLGQPHPVEDGLNWRDVREAFDAEVGRLPERFRLPLVLCCLQGRTRAEAAAELGWTEGAVRGRLERGRKLLQSRFVRKGVTLPAVLLSALVEQSIPATASPVDFAPSAVAARLAEGLVRSMAVARAKVAAWATAAVLLVGTVAAVGWFGPASAQPKPPEGTPTPPAPIATAADAERNLDTFVLRVSLAPEGEGKWSAKYPLSQVLLYVPNLRLEPPANGPDGEPVAAHARITKEQAKKIVDALATFDFFKDGSAFKDPLTAKLPLTNARDWPHIGIAVRFQNGEDAARTERLLAWLPDMLPPLDAIRACLDGDAARALDQLLAQLAEDRKRWDSTLDADLRKLQGSWVVDLTDDDRRLGLASGLTAKCVIDGKNITLKPKVQLNPLLDLETIRGTFKLAGDKGSRRMTIKGARDTVSKTEPGTWTVPYEVSGTTLRLLLPPAGAAPPPAMEPNGEKGERLFVLKRVAPGLASEWGEESNGVQTRIRTAKAKYAAGESPTFDLDVRAAQPRIAGKSWHWMAPRLGRLARIEVDGVWYSGPADLRKLMLRELALGQTVEKWVTVSLVDDSWATEATAETRARRLVLNPGKHKVRIGYDFSPSEGGMVPASPVSGPVEIEILPEKAVDHASDWGDPSKGVSARIRAAKPKFGFGEPVTLELDVKAAGDGGRELAVWTAARNSSPARLEVGGVWYKRVPVEVAKVPAPTLTAGEQVDGWATLNLSDQWVVEYYTGLPPGQAGQRLILSPGKYTFRVGFSFSNPTASAVPVSGKLEIEVLPPVPAGKVAQFRDGGWRSKAAWSPHGPSGVRNLAVAPGDKYLYTVGNDGLVLWDMTGPKPAAEQTVRYTTDGLQFAGLDRDGLPLLFRQKVRPQPAEATTDLTVLRLPDMGENAKPQLAVPTDTVRAWAVRPDGKALALGFGWWDSVRLVDVGTGKDRTLEAPAGPKDQLAFLHRLLFSRDGKTLIGLGSNEYPVTGKMNGLVVRWDAETGRVRWKSQESEGQPVGVLTADGKTLVTGWRLGKVFTVWDLATGTKLREIPTNGAEGIGVSADGKTVAIGTHTEEIARQPVLEIWDLAGKTVGQRVPVPAAVRSISFRDDGRAFATADINGEVRWWVREK